MKAISIRQPWAWLIVRPDLVDPAARQLAMEKGEIKDMENRDWATTHRGPVLIHASKGMTVEEYDEVFDFLDDGFPNIKLPPYDSLERGGIVGKAEITGCTKLSNSKWFFGSYGFVLTNQEPLAFRPCPGRLMLFEVGE